MEMMEEFLYTRRCFHSVIVFNSQRAVTIRLSDMNLADDGVVENLNVEKSPRRAG